MPRPLSPSKVCHCEIMIDPRLSTNRRAYDHIMIYCYSLRQSAWISLLVNGSIMQMKQEMTPLGSKYAYIKAQIKHVNEHITNISHAWRVHVPRIRIYMYIRVGRLQYLLPYKKLRFMPSKELPYHIQWNLGIRDTQGTVKNCPDFWGGLISQVHFYVMNRP